MRRSNGSAQLWRRAAPSSQRQAVPKTQRRNLPRRREKSSPRSQASTWVQGGAVSERIASFDAQRRTSAPLRSAGRPAARLTLPSRSRGHLPIAPSATRVERSRSWSPDVCAASVAKEVCPLYRRLTLLLPPFVQLPTAGMLNVPLARTRTDEADAPTPSLAVASKLWKLRAGCLGFLDVGFVVHDSIQSCHKAGN